MTSGRYAYEGLERILHERARLSILTSLATHPNGLLFSELKELCALTDGNLSRHISVLHESDLIEVWKGYEKRRPQTLCRLTDDGRKRFRAYLVELERLVHDAASSKRTRRKPKLPPGWSPA